MTPSHKQWLSVATRISNTKGSGRSVISLSLFLTLLTTLLYFQSSTGQSVHSATSGRANSLTGYGLNGPETPGLAPGLFILGSVPAIIRCWLTTTFKHDTMLYAAVCSGSYSSFLDLRLINKLGFQDHITATDENLRTIKLPMYLPEAVPVSASSHASSPAPQLPSLTVQFTVVENNNDEKDSKAIQIFLGSDMLRAHNADILLSSNQLTLYDDERSKLRIPLVRPEDEHSFKSLHITSGSHECVELKPKMDKTTPLPPNSSTSKEPSEVLSTGLQDTSAAASTKLAGSATTSGSEDGSLGRRSLEQRPRLTTSLNSRAEPKDAQEPSPGGTLSRAGPSPAIWNNWRRETEKSGSTEWTNVSSKTPGATYQRRDTGIKVLKKPGTRTLSTSTSQSTLSSATGQSRFFDEGRRREDVPDEGESSVPPMKRSVSGEKPKENVSVLAKARSTNPVGGASAFPWLNTK